MLLPQEDQTNRQQVLMHIQKLVLILIRFGAYLFEKFGPNNI